MHPQHEPMTLEASATASESNTTAKPWLLWTGVVGALFALLAMGAVLVLSQKLEVQAQTLAKLEEAAMQPQALVLALREELMDGIKQQQAMQKSLLQQQTELSEKLEELARKKEAGWQLTDAPAIRFMLAQLQASALLNPDPIRLAQFLQHWQSSLSDAGIAQDHALMQALTSERNALRKDIPTWSSEATSWQTLRSELAATRLALAMNQDLAPETSGVAEGAISNDWWQRLTSLVRIRPAGVSDAELAQTLSQRGIWPVQTALAMEVIQVGLLTNQPQLVNQASERLVTLLSQQAPELLTTWQSRLQLWKTWSGLAQPEWHYLNNHLKQQAEQSS